MQVVQVRQKETGLHYALKVVDKNLVLRNKCTDYIKTERRLLDRLESPWVVRLHFTFQDPYSLYFVLELCPNGSAPSPGSMLAAASKYYRPLQAGLCLVCRRAA